MKIAPLTTATLLPALLALVVFLAPPSASADDGVDIQQRKADLVLKLRINRAIDRGANWLALQQERSGAFHLASNPMGGIWPGARHTFGETALAVYTLAHCGYEADHKRVKKALLWLKSRWKDQMESEFHTRASSYSLCLLVLALHELYAKPPSETTDEDTERYGRARVQKRNPCGFPNWARHLVRQVLDWLLENQAEKGLFRYPGGIAAPGRPRGGKQPNPAGPVAPGFVRRGPAFHGPEDLSNTQYVLLAVWVGTRCGYEVDPGALTRVAERLLAWQQETGTKVVRAADPDETKSNRYGNALDRPVVQDEARGFGYTPGDAPTGSMTAAGLSSLVTLKAMLREIGALTPAHRTSLTKGIWDAIAWHQVNYSVRDNPPLGHTWHFYYLYGLERAMVIADKRVLGEHDWYKEGARLLVDRQKDDGRWMPPELFAGAPRMPGAGTYSMSLTNSCFALLFLERAAFEPKQPVLEDPVTTPGSGG